MPAAWSPAAFTMGSDSQWPVSRARFLNPSRLLAIHSVDGVLRDRSATSPCSQTHSPRSPYGLRKPFATLHRGQQNGTGLVLFFNLRSIRDRKSTRLNSSH